VKVLYFAWLRQRIGRAEEEVSPPASVTTIAALVDFLRARGPGYAAAFEDLKLIRCAVNQEHAGMNAKLEPGDEVAFFPPVTGG
jgi:molybdopterin synthase sulfur carrier subunit